MTTSTHARRTLLPGLTPAARLAAAGWALLATAATGLAQPAGVTVTDLGSFAGAASTVQTRNLTLTNAAPVAWYKIRLPRIADPHRYLDISTSGVGFGDSEIALYSSTGTLIASDDDDGANNYSALSFGITSPGAAGRVPPGADAGQTPGEPNNGRDGTLSGDPMVGLLGTAGDYYIAVTRFNATFGNSFGVIPPAGPASDFSMLLTVRMHTPGGQIAPTVNGADLNELFDTNEVSLSASASANTTGVSVDLSPFGGSAGQPLVFDAGSDQWFGDNIILNDSLTQPGTFPLRYRASNAIGDVAVDVAQLTVEALAGNCEYGSGRPIAPTPGTTIYSYSTAFGNIDGPWTAACFNPAQPPTGNDVWFRFEPTRSGTLTLSTCNSDTGATGIQPDTLLGFRGRCDDAGFSACGDDVGGCGLGTRLPNIPVIAGQEYNIAVRAWSGDIADGKLAVTFVPLSCSPADIADSAGSPAGGGDGQVNNGDFQCFFQQFFTANCPNCGPVTTTPCNPADIAQSDASSGPDGCVNNGDFQLFFTSFFVGCP